MVLVSLPRRSTCRVVLCEGHVTHHFNDLADIGAAHQGVCFIDEETGKLEYVKKIIPDDQRDVLRFNDGIIDAKGRFWLAEIDRKGLATAHASTMILDTQDKGKGRLWRYDPDGSLHQMEDGLYCGNGLCFSPDNKTCKLADKSRGYQGTHLT